MLFSADIAILEISKTKWHEKSFYVLLNSNITNKLEMKL